MKILSTAAVSILATTLAFTQSSAIADSIDASPVFNRIHLANTLRNDTQYMARLSCFVYGGENIAENRRKLRAAVAEFQQVSEALIKGDPALGIEAETNQRVRNAVTDLADLWAELGGLMQEVAGGREIDGALMAEIDLYSLSQLESANRLTTRIANVYGESMRGVPLILTLTVDMAGRQIMRTEKAAKEACLIGTGVDAVQNSANLGKTVALFSATLDALLGGFPGLIMAAPTPEIAAALETVRADWAAPKARLAALAQGVAVTMDDRQVIGRGLEQVSTELAAVTGLYEAVRADN